MVKDWTWEKIKYELSLKGKKLVDLADHHKCDRARFSNVKKVPNPRVQTIIAKVLEREPQVIWPTRYNSDGKPVVRQAWLNRYGDSFTSRRAA